MTVGDGEYFLLQADVLHLDGETHPNKHVSSTEVITGHLNARAETPHPECTANRPQSGRMLGGFNLQNNELVDLRRSIRES